MRARTSSGELMRKRNSRTLSRLFLNGLVLFGNVSVSVSVAGVIVAGVLVGGVLVVAGPEISAQGRKKPGQDKIITTTGKVLRSIEIQREGLTEVVYVFRNKEKKVPVSEIQRIEWQPVPVSFVRAGLSEERGDYETAANLYQNAADSSTRAALKAHASFRALRALLLSGLADANKAKIAADQAASWIAANSEHRRLPDAQQIHGRALLAAQQGRAAVDAFDKLEQLATGKFLGPAWIANAKFGKGLAYVAMGEFGKARQAYNAATASLLSSDSADSKKLQSLIVASKVGVGECYIAEKKYRQAKNHFRGLLAAAGRRNPALRSAALCGTAQANYEEAIKKRKDSKLLREAQLALAEVTATDLEDSDATPKALYYFGKTLLALGKSKEGPDFARRAEALFRNVVEQYPESRWVAVARKELEK